MFGLSPNSTGQFGNLLARGTEARQGTMGSAYGVFYVPANVMGAINYTDDVQNAGEGSVDGVGFDLSRSSVIYSGTEMQPKALQTLACIRF